MFLSRTPPPGVEDDWSGSPLLTVSRHDPWEIEAAHADHVRRTTAEAGVRQWGPAPTAAGLPRTAER